MAGATRLKDTTVAKAKRASKPYKLSDGGGLFLYVTPAGTKSWRWQFRYNKKFQLMCLGIYPTMTLEQARLSHTRLRAVLRSGRNPAHQIATIKKVDDSFAAITALWLEQWKPGKDPVYADKTTRRMTDEVLPKIGLLPIREIEVPEIVAVAKAVEDRGAPELARMTLRNIGQVYRYAISHGLASRNPARDVKPSDVFHQVRVKHYPRITAQALPKLLLDMERYSGTEITRCAMWAMARTFLRTSELVEAPWSEFDLDAARWTIPPERMKLPSTHIVPLSRQMSELLKHVRELTGNKQWVFPSNKDRNKPMSKATIYTALLIMGYKGKMCGHGYRGVASTILHEQGYNHDHIETQLSHLNRDPVSAAYDYAKYLEPRAKMMQDWSDYLDQQLLKAKAAAETK